MKTNRWLSLLRKCVKRSGDPPKLRKKISGALIIINMLKKERDTLKEESDKLRNALILTAKANKVADEKPIRYRV